MDIQKMVDAELQRGYSGDNALAKVCQDIVLKAIASSSLRRVYVKIEDEHGFKIQSKIDLGVHNRLGIEQEVYCFDIAYDNEGASLLINSNEQMFAEKLRSLLRFGPLSTRVKDVFDLYYLKDYVDMEKLQAALDEYIFRDEKMREKQGSDIVKRLTRTFKDKEYVSYLEKSDKRWIDEEISGVLNGLLEFADRI